MTNDERMGQHSKLKTIFISTGEVSGDLQGALLIEALKRRASDLGVELEIVALGGDRMAKAGATLMGNTSGIGSVGIVENLPFVLPTLQVQRRAKQYLHAHPPDLVVLIDYAGPNMSLGSYVRRWFPKLPIVYYIAPQMWVWWPFKGDTQRIINMIDLLLAIFPGEACYFKERGANVISVGHPLVDRMRSSPSREQARAALGITDEQVAVALLPASRRQEVKYMLPVIFEAAKAIQSKLPQVHFWIPLSLEAYRRPIEEAVQQYGLRATVIGAEEQGSEGAGELGSGEAGERRSWGVEENIDLYSSPTPPLTHAPSPLLAVLAASDLAIAKSGTVNLELALLNVPQVVLYRVSPLTFWIGRALLNFSISFMSPTNLVLMREIVPELLQSQATPENIVREAMDLLLNPERRQQTLKDYQEMRDSLGEADVCDRAAREIFNLLKVKS